jgi:hypothetical protein
LTSRGSERASTSFLEHAGGLALCTMVEGRKNKKVHAFSRLWRGGSVLSLFLGFFFSFLGAGGGGLAWRFAIYKERVCFGVGACTLATCMLWLGGGDEIDGGRRCTARRLLCMYNVAARRVYNEESRIEPSPYLPTELPTYPQVRLLHFSANDAQRLSCLSLPDARRQACMPTVCNVGLKKMASPVVSKPLDNKTPQQPLTPLAAACCKGRRDGKRNG